MNRIVLLGIFLGLFLLADIYLYRAFRIFFQEKSVLIQRLFLVVYWLVPVASIAFIFVNKYFSRTAQIYITNILAIIVLSKVLAFIFMLIADAGILAGRYFASSKPEEVTTGYTRREFVSKLGIIAAFVPFLSMVYGMVRTATDFKISRISLPFKKLPAAFDGLKIVQISDIHTGTFLKKSEMDRAIDLILAEKPDVIVFTGDLVNSTSDEALPFIENLKRLQAPLGVFSVLGNHDYGDYHRWDSEQAKQENMNLMFKIQRDMGFRLLMNEHVVFERNGEKLALVGIENWGANLRFPRYGKLKEALQGLTPTDFKVLLSHDPSHWDAQVRPEFADVDLTLSGHTHGFQFGVEIPGFKWSPSQYIYKQWAGLYEQGEQKLYVNRGLGCVGYAGRVGIRPEISVLTLTQA